MRSGIYSIAIGICSIMHAGCDSSSDPGNPERPVNPVPEISGTVFNASNFQPINDAIISTQPPTQEVTSGIDGKFSLSAPSGSGGRFLVFADHIAYRQQQKSVTVLDGEVATADFALQSAVSGLVASPTIASFNSDTLSKTVRLSSNVPNTGFSTLVSDPSWISVTPETGMIVNGETLFLYIEIDRELISAETLAVGQIIVNADNGLAGAFINVQVALAPSEDSPVVPAPSPNSETSISFKPEMVRIEGGVFEQGSRTSGDSERPVRNVAVEAFELGKYELTVEQFNAFVEDSNYRTDAERDLRGEGCRVWGDGQWDWSKDRNWRSPGFEQTDSHPAVCISWNDAKAYITWLNKETEDEGGGYRLPTESEWEYAARAGTTGDFSFSGDEAGQCNYANGADSSIPNDWNWSKSSCNDGTLFTAAVGIYRANNNDLHDMHGNAWEWVEDCWHASYSGAVTDGRAWTVDCEQDRHVMRGGAWVNKSSFLRSAFRNANPPHNRGNYTGFRVARTLP